MITPLLETSAGIKKTAVKAAVTARWWRRWDSNPRPQRCERCALPTELRPLLLARMFHELLSRDREDGRATRQSQGVGPEAYLNGTSQGSTPEDARKNGHIRGRSK
jgi:hypothetical protein